MPNCNAYFQRLVTYLNRILINKPDDFVVGILQTEFVAQGRTFDSFLGAWLSRMDMIVHWEAHRIKTLALCMVLPYLTGEMVQKHFAEIGRLLFTRLEDELYHRLTDGQARVKYSPNRFGVLNKQEQMRNPNALNIKIHEKISQRYEKLKREDWLLDFDLIEIFWQKVRDLMAKLQIQSIEPLVDCLPEEQLKHAFTNLVNGFSPKHEQQKAEALERQNSEQ